MDNNIVKANVHVLPELWHSITDLLVSLDKSGPTTLNAAWTLMHLATSTVLNLKRAGAAVTEEGFVKMARDVYRSVLADEEADGGLPPPPAAGSPRS